MNGEVDDIRDGFFIAKQNLIHIMAFNVKVFSELYNPNTVMWKFNINLKKNIYEP